MTSEAAGAATATRREPVTLLIAALGGQGGGVLADWIGHAARAEGLTVQATSTPGVSQRTGATNYYLEIAPPPEPGMAAPVLALCAVPGCVDVLLCAELLEAARMLERGMSTPSRTTVIASTHRVYTTQEKMHAEDGRFDSGRIEQALCALSRRAILFDMQAVAATHGAAISAALFGALAGSRAVALTRRRCEEAIRAAGKAVGPSLAAFAQAFAQAGEGAATPATGGGEAAAHIAPVVPAALAARLDLLPRRVGSLAGEGAARLTAYQDARYAGRYLSRLEQIVRAEDNAGGGERPHEVAAEVARRLALWMGYGDLIEVAAQKARRSRFERIRGEAQARAGELVRVYDLFAPSALELAAVLPRRLGAWLERRAGDSAARGGKGMRLQASSVSGALALRLVAALRPFRPSSLRFAREQEAIDDWLALIAETLAGGGQSQVDLALELARLPGLRKGYGDTHDNGVADFQRILDAYRAGDRGDPQGAAQALRGAVQATLEKSGAPRRRGDAAAARPQAIVWSKPSVR